MTRWLKAGDHTLAVDGLPLLMGIVNITPNSFADGGRYLAPQAAIDHALRLADEGADLLDLGAESTRPGAKPVPAEDELARLLPVLRELRRRVSIPISIDTYKAAVAGPCLAEGASMINDISGLSFDPVMGDTVAASTAALCLMHTPAPPLTMQRRAVYGDVVREVASTLTRAVSTAEAAGVVRDRLLIDPGLGFGKTAEHNWALLRDLDTLHALGLPVLIGASRKSFIGAALVQGRSGPTPGEPWPVAERLEGSLAIAVWCALQRVAVLRVHDVDATARVLKIVQQLIG
ncbi:MAG TPA: dihydropteroate synthase [bacterium]